MSKNAYEIRLAILEMAKSLTLEKFHTINEKYTTIWNSAEQGKKPFDLIKQTPEFPKTNDILNLANTLYSFVENQNPINEHK